MNGPYRTAACVDAAAEQHACSPALCCACPSCRGASQLLARWVAEQDAAPSPPRTGLGARVSRAVSAVTLGLVASALVITIGLAAGDARSARDAQTIRVLFDSQKAAGEYIERLQADKLAAEQKADKLAARLAEEQPSPDVVSGGAHGGNGHRTREARLLLEEMSKRPMPWPSFLLGYAGPESHDPDVLLTRALRLLKDGLDLKIERTTLSFAELTEAIGDGSWPVLPLKQHDQVVGFVIDPARAPEDTARLRRLGLERGDVITAVNGHPLWSPDRAIEAYSHVRERRKALFEIIRGQRRVVLLVQIR